MLADGDEGRDEETGGVVDKPQVVACDAEWKAVAETWLVWEEECVEHKHHLVAEEQEM